MTIYKFAKKQLRNITLALAFVSLLGFSIPSYAATTIPSQSQDFSMSMIACMEVFNFGQKVADLAAGNSNTKPYDKKGCVSQDKLFVNGAAQKNNYCNFDTIYTNTGNTKQDFCSLNLPLMGVTNQNVSTYNEDASVKQAVASVNRAENVKLDKIFTDEYKCRIYPSYGSNCLQGQGVPRWFSTGVDKLIDLGNNKYTYLGGNCDIQNGQISVRSSLNGLDTYKPSDYGIDVNNPSKECKFQNNATVEERSIHAFQYIYVIKYPTRDECKTWFGFNDSNVDQCMSFFRTKYGGQLAGNNNANTNMFIHTHTFYASWDDGYRSTACVYRATVNGVRVGDLYERNGSKMVRNGNPVECSLGANDGDYKIISFNFLDWENPDIGGPRANDPNGVVRTYDGYSTYAF